MPGDDFFRFSLCSLYKDTIVPCINDGVVKDLLVATVDREDGCCNQLKSSIADAFGADLTTAVDVLLKLVGNSLCSVKTFPSEDDGLSRGSPDVWSSDVWPKVLQMKHEGVCSAVTGHEFHLTAGETAIIESSDAIGDGAPYGICFQPMSALVEHVNKYPIVQRLSVPAFPSDSALAGFFGGDTCVTQTQLSLPFLSAVFTMEYAVSIFMNMMAAFENPSSTEPMQGSNGNDGTTRWRDSWVVDPRGPITIGGSVDAVASNDDGVSRSLAGSDWFGESSSSESSGSGLSVNEFLGNTLTSFGATLGEDRPSTSNDIQGTDDDAVSTLGGDENEFHDTVSPDSFLQPCYHIPHDLTCDYGRETIQLMLPDVAVMTPVTEALAATPAVSTVQRLRK
ncbi:hypothetical protein FI667_g16414, partial [Globisporangium splendens]